MNKFLLAAAAVAVLSTPVSAAVFSDNFNYGPATALNAADSLFGGNWTTTDGTVDYLASGSGFGNLCGSAPYCIDLDGSTNNAGIFSTTMIFAEGTYNVFLNLLGNGRGGNGTVTISLGSSITQTLGSGDSLSGSFAFQVGPGGSALSFANLGGDNVGLILQSVSVELVPSAVPLPAAGGLLLAGLAGLAGLRRRKGA